MQMLAEAGLQRVPVIIALAPAHREVTALDNVLVEDARVCGGHWLALRPHALQSAPGSRCSPTLVWFRSMISPGSAPARNTLSSPRTTPRRPPGAPSRAPTPRRRQFEMPSFWDSNSNLKKEKKELFFSSIQPARATQSMMYVPLQVNKFQKISLLIVQ